MQREGINKAILFGIIAAQPRLGPGEQGDSWFFTLETEEEFFTAGRKSIHTEKHQIQVSRHFAHSTLRKGQLVYLEGKIKTKMTIDEYQVRHYNTIIAVSKISILIDVS